MQNQQWNRVEEWQARSDHQGITGEIRYIFYYKTNWFPGADISSEGWWYQYHEQLNVKNILDVLCVITYYNITYIHC